MTLKEILDKLKGTEHESIIEEVNKSVDTLVYQKTNALTKANEKLKAKLNEMSEKETSSLKDKIAKDLVGDDEKKLKALLRLTDTKGLKEKKEIKEAYEKTIKEFDNIFDGKKDGKDNDDDNDDENEVIDFNYDLGIDEKQYASKQEIKQNDNEVISEALTEDK